MRKEELDGPESSGTCEVVRILPGLLAPLCSVANLHRELFPVDPSTLQRRLIRFRTEVSAG